jgi:hypothetical protein
MSEISIDRLAGVLQKIKAKRSELSAKFDEEDKLLQEKQKMVSGEILNIFKEQGITNTTTVYGTISRVTTDKFWCSDWQPFLEYIREHDALHLLHQRITTAAMREWIESHKDDLPPALNCDREYDIRLYKPRKDIK